jgi:hypothetical protein
MLLEKQSYPFARQMFQNCSDVLLNYFTEGKLDPALEFYFKSISDLEEDVEEIFEQTLDSIVLIESKDKQTLDSFLKKYQKFPLRVIEYPEFFWSDGYAIFCCNTSLFKQLFTEYDKAREAYKQFLLDGEADVLNRSHIRCAISFFNRFWEDGLEHCYVIFDNSVHAVSSIRSNCENVFDDQYVLKCSEEPKSFVCCDQVLHNQINFYHFACFLTSVMNKRPLEEFAFVFPNNSKEKEFYQKFSKQLKGKK